MYTIKSLLRIVLDNYLIINIFEGDWDKNYVTLIIDDHVEVNEERINYDGFNFIVEVHENNFFLDILLCLRANLGKETYYF